MTVGRRWRLRCHSVPPADRRCFPSSAVLPQPLLASLALGVSPWAHGRGMDWDRLTLIGTGYARALHAHGGSGLLLLDLADCGRRSFFRHSEATSNQNCLFGFWAFGFWPFAMALHSSGLCWLPSASHGANGHRPLAVSAIRIALPRGGGGVRRAACLLGF